MTKDEFKAVLANVRDTAKHAADPREPAALLAGALLSHIEANEAAAAPAPAPAEPELTLAPAEGA